MKNVALATKAKVLNLNLKRKKAKWEYSKKHKLNYSS